MAIGLAIACASEKTSFLAIGSGLGLLLVGLVFGSVVKPEYGALIHLAAYLWLAVALIWPLVHAVKLSDNKTYALLTSLAIPLVTAALILNLKRGPWLGVLVATFLLLWFYRKKWLLLLLAAITVSFLMVPDVKNRLAASEEHFFIAGGRSAIWQIGFDLAPRYPLGIGFENSGVLRNYSDEVPPELTHFHNNFLNILVETGLFGLLCYLWWVAALLAKSIVPALKTQRTDWDIERRSHSVVLCSLGLAILAWQIAGLVEYNFGDSEVLLVALLLWGFLESIALQSSRHASRTTL
jgi:O-antigen ligase